MCAHRADAPLEAALAGHGEGGQGAALLLQLLLPEAGREVQGGEDARAGLADFVQAVLHLRDRVLVRVGCLVQRPVVEADAQASSVRLLDNEYGGVPRALALLNASLLQEVVNVVIDKLAVFMGKTKLSLVNGLLFATLEANTWGMALQWPRSLSSLLNTS